MIKLIDARGKATNFPCEATLYLPEKCQVSKNMREAPEVDAGREGRSSHLATARHTGGAAGCI
jgi:hypothetical protein